MKKVFVLLLGMILTIGVMAQNVNGNFKINQVDKNAKLVNTPIDLKKPALLAPGDVHHEWINFGLYLCDATVGDPNTNYRTYSSIIFPDTFVMVRYKNSTGPGFTYDNVNWCSVGSVLDPTSAILKMGGIDVKNYAAYIVDSISIPYWYDRFSDPSVVDTLVIQMYKPANLSGYTYTSGANAGKKAFAVPKYSRAKKEGAMADWVKRIPLTSADTVTAHLGFIEEAIPGFTITNGGPVGITWTFKSGSAYNYLDTIPLAKWDSVQGVQKPLNAFYWLYYVDRSQEELFEYNNGVTINTQQRYSDIIFPGQTSSSFPGVYLSFSMWTYPLYPYVNFKITWTETVGVNDQAKDVKVSLYPIPAERSENATLELNLTSKKSISIDVYDLLGHKVSSVTNGNYEAGKHSFAVNTSTLDAGMYICKVVADGAVKTIKFEVR
jgi:hypothetical protein